MLWTWQRNQLQMTQKELQLKNGSHVKQTRMVMKKRVANQPGMPKTMSREKQPHLYLKNGLTLQGTANVTWAATNASKRTLRYRLCELLLIAIWQSGPRDGNLSWSLWCCEHVLLIFIVLSQCSSHNDKMRNLIRFNISSSVLPNKVEKYLSTVHTSCSNITVSNQEGLYWKCFFIPLLQTQNAWHFNFFHCLISWNQWYVEAIMLLAFRILPSYCSAKKPTKLSWWQNP